MSDHRLDIQISENTYNRLEAARQKLEALGEGKLTKSELVRLMLEDVLDQIDIEEQEYAEGNLPQKNKANGSNSKAEHN